MIEADENHLDFAFQGKIVTLDRVEEVIDLKSFLEEVFCLKSTVKNVIGFVDEDHRFFSVSEWPMIMYSLSTDQVYHICIASLPSIAEMVTKDNRKTLMAELYNEQSKYEEVIAREKDEECLIDLFSLIYRIPDFDSFLRTKALKFKKKYCVLIVKNKDPFLVDLSIINVLEKTELLYVVKENMNDLKVNRQLITGGGQKPSLQKPSRASEKLYLLKKDAVIDEREFTRDQQQFIDLVNQMTEIVELKIIKRNWPQNELPDHHKPNEMLLQDCKEKTRSIYYDFFKRSLLNFFDYLELIILLDYNEDFGNCVFQFYKPGFAAIDVVEHGLKHKNNYRIDTSCLHIKEIIDIIVSVQDHTQSNNVDTTSVKLQLLNLEDNLLSEFVTPVSLDLLSCIQNLINDAITAKYSIAQFFKKLNVSLSKRSSNNSQRRSHPQSSWTRKGSVFRYTSSNEPSQDFIKINTFELNKLHTKLEKALGYQEYSLVKHLINIKDPNVMDAMNLYNQEHDFDDLAETLQIIIQNNDAKSRTRSFKDEDKIGQSNDHTSQYKKEEIPENIILTFGDKRQLVNFFQPNQKDFYYDNREKGGEVKSSKFLNAETKVYQARASKYFANSQPIEVVIEMIKTDSEHKSVKSKSAENFVSVETVINSNTDKGEVVSNSAHKTNPLNSANNAHEKRLDTPMFSKDPIYHTNSETHKAKKYNTNPDYIFTRRQARGRPNNGSARFISKERPKMNNKFFELRRTHEFQKDTNKHSTSPFQVTNNLAMSPVSPIKGSIDNSISDYSNNFFQIRAEPKNENTEFFKFMNLARKEKTMAKGVDTRKPMLIKRNSGEI